LFDGEIDMATFQACVLEDANYKKYKDVLKTVKAGANLLQIKQEAKTLHATRGSRELYKSRVSPDPLIAAEMQDSANRSRMIELKALLLNEQELLESSISLCKKHLKAAYQAELQKLGTTVAARSGAVDTIFARGSEYLSQVNVVLAILDLYIKDIDAAGYKHTNVRELLKLDRAGREVV
jgi:hypothetical protein